MKYFFLVLLAVALFAACNKTPTSTANRENILRNGRWKVTGGTLTVKKPNGKDTILNYTDWIPYCHKDDYIKFDSLMHAAIFPGPITCNAQEPDSIGFVWKLSNNENTIDLYDGFLNTYAVTETILLPFYFDTLSTSPILVLDTVYGILDTAAGYTRVLPVLDTQWKLHFDTTWIATNSVTGLDIYNASISYFSQSTFTINYSLISTYPDSTHHRTGVTIYGTDFADTIRPDTFHYSVIYSNF